MHAITVGPGERLAWAETADPGAPGSGAVRIAVEATAVNRADLLQRAGHYPPPPGASDILGLECAGTVEAVGAGVRDWAPGDRVAALLAGGGYAQRVVVPEGHLLAVPDEMAATDAAAVPEALCTAWSNLVQVGRLRGDELALIHGGAGGIGSVAVQVARHAGARAVTTARAQHAAALAALGAEVVVDYRSQDFVAVVRELGGADVVLDVQGASYLARNLEVLRTDGRLVIIGLQGGTRAALDIGALLAKRATVAATTLRNRSLGFKAKLVAELRDAGWSEWLRPVVHEVIPITEAERAHEVFNAGGHLGKVVLEVPG